MKEKEALVQELKALPIGLIMGGSLIIAAALISFGMIVAAALLSLAALAIVSKPEEKPRVITSVASKPKHIRGSVARRVRS